MVTVPQNVGTLNLLCYQFADLYYKLTWTVNQTPVNLTGYFAILQVRPVTGSTQTLATLKSDAGGDGTIVLGGALGTIELNLPGTFTAEMEEGTYVYDLVLTDSNDFRARIVQGTFTVIAGVSSPTH